MDDAKNKKPEDLNKAVKSRIKGLGLDALFHQVDISKKDEDIYRPKKKMDTPEERDLMERLKKNHYKVTVRPKQSFKEVFKKVFSAKMEACVGLNIGSSSIKLVEMRNVKGKNHLSKAIYIPIPHIVTTSQEKYETFIKETIPQTFDMLTLKKSCIYTLIPRSKVIVKSLILPTQDLNEVRRMVEFEAEHHIPFPIQEAEIDYHIIQREDNKTHLLLAAVKKEEITRHLYLLEKIGIVPDVIGLSSAALYNSMLSSYPQDGISLQINIGTVFTDINIVQDEKLRFTRGIQWGAKSLTLKLADSLNVSFDNAEKIKKENGILLSKKSENDINRTVSGQACQWADHLVSEIKRTIQHFQIKEGLTHIDRIILTGGGARLLHINEYLRDKLKTRTILQKPFNDIPVDSHPAVLSTYFHELSMVFGLVWRGRENSAVALNLLPQKMKDSRQIKTQQVKQLAAGGLIILILGLSLLLPALILGLRNRTIGMLDRKIEHLETQITIVQDLKGKIRTIEDYISTKQSCVEILREITMIVTPDIIINRFSFEKNDSVSLVGEADSHNSVVNLSRIFRESQYFKNAALKYSRKKDRLKENVDFEIFCMLEIESE